jgi:hypothetical protein
MAARERRTNTDHPHEVLLPVLLVTDVSAVTVALTRSSPTPETTALLLFFTNGTFTWCI